MFIYVDSPFQWYCVLGQWWEKFLIKLVGIATPASPPPAVWSTVQFSLLGARHPLSLENSGHHWPVWLITAKHSIDFLQAIIAAYYGAQHITKARSIPAGHLLRLLPEGPAVPEKYPESNITQGLLRELISVLAGKWQAASGWRISS